MTITDFEQLQILVKKRTTFLEQYNNFNSYIGNLGISISELKLCEKYEESIDEETMVALQIAEKKLSLIKEEEIIDVQTDN